LESGKRNFTLFIGNEKHGLMHCKNKTDKLTCYSDADYAGDCTTRKSTSGYVSLLAGGPVVWSSCRQRCVSLSTTEAEFIAASEASKDVWLRKLLADIGYAMNARKRLT